MEKSPVNKKLTIPGHRARKPLPRFTIFRHERSSHVSCLPGCCDAGFLHTKSIARPNLGQTEFRLDSVPVSEINVPIRISMKPLTMLAEKNVDTLFYLRWLPGRMGAEGCDTRYKYVPPRTASDEGFRVQPQPGIYGDITRLWDQHGPA